MTQAALDHFEDPDYPYGDAQHIQRAFRIMAGGAESMAKVLINLARTSKSDYVKAQAATAILDRVGLTDGPDIQVNVLGDAGQVEQRSIATQVVLARLEALANPQVIDGQVLAPVPVVESAPDMFD